ncbi:hypothetical protein [Aeromicrobium sp.]|uniref:hypothetical protein n=1 Tax=Aeromicrobium sp. TaxID=1871063 RepID=UPI004033E6B4
MTTIPRRFNGPEHSGNGGWVSGLLAAQQQERHGSTVVRATLRQPPPLEVPLTWEDHPEEVRLVTAGGALIGEATSGSFEHEPLTAPSVDAAEQGVASYPGFASHPFDLCFTCGTAREPGDGLRLFTGPVGDGRTAGTWTPHPAVAGSDGLLDVPTTWAALDCPGGWAADFTAQPMVLGRMTAEVLRRPAAGEALLASGLLRERDGRKFRTATALHTVDGELLGRAEQVWIEIDLARFS